MVIISQNDTQTIADNDPDNINFDADTYEGIIWFNITDNRMFFATDTEWVLYDNMKNKMVERSDIILNGTDLNNTLTGLSTNEISDITSKDGSVVITKPSSDIYNLQVSGTSTSTGTIAQLLALKGMTIGQTFYTTDNTNYQFNKLWTWSGRTWQVIGETVELITKTSMIEGNTVEISGGNSSENYEVKKTPDSNTIKVIGVIALQGVGTDQWCTIATSGIWSVACDASSNAYDRANFLSTHGTDGLAQETSSTSSKIFAKILENKTISVNGGLLKALIHTTEQK